MQDFFITGFSKVEPAAQMQQPAVEPVHKEIAMAVDEPEVDEPEAETAPQVQEKTTWQADKPTVHETYGYHGSRQSERQPLHDRP
ncbi:MAG: hypothetical protein MJY68_09855 [Bacteroidaceae bacterium]|nr:hypothetical protein [Bacteroidaceae bacterium]